MVTIPTKVSLSTTGKEWKSLAAKILETSLIEVAVSATDKTCDVGGRIGVLVAGGNGQYTFDWADIPGTNNPQNRINLEGGTYTS